MIGMASQVRFSGYGLLFDVLDTGRGMCVAMLIGFRPSRPGRGTPVTLKPKRNHDLHVHLARAERNLDPHLARPEKTRSWTLRNSSQDIASLISTILVSSKHIQFGPGSSFFFGAPGEESE